MAATYRVDGRTYHVRYGCHLGNTRSDDDYVFTGVIPLIGTVRCADHNRSQEFPPQAVVDLFPGFIGARFLQDYSVVYDGLWLRPRAVWGGDTLFMPGHEAKIDRETQAYAERGNR